MRRKCAILNDVIAWDGGGRAIFCRPTCCHQIVCLVRMRSDGGSGIAGSFGDLLQADQALVHQCLIVALERDHQTVTAAPALSSPAYLTLTGCRSRDMILPLPKQNG